MEMAILIFFRCVRGLSKIPSFSYLCNDVLVSSENLEHGINEVTPVTMQDGQNEMGNMVSTIKKKKVEVCISDFPSVHSPSLNALCNWQNEDSFIIYLCSKIGWDKIR